MNGHPVSLFTTLALIDGRIDGAILKAFGANLSLAEIGSITVVSESEKDEIRARYELFRHSKIRFVKVDGRPRFADMLQIMANRWRVDDIGIALLMNADIGVRSGQVIDKLTRCFGAIRSRFDRLAFALTRYDFGEDSPALTLKTQIGLPNIMSADVWAFDEPVKLEKDAFYSLGQMFCDQFFGHDLLASGYSVFNPCLDLEFVHYEEETKSTEYYKSLHGQGNVQAMLKRHWRESVDPNLNYRGLPWLSTEWMLAGYLPVPVSMHNARQRVFLLLQEFHPSSASRGYVENLLKGYRAVEPRPDIFLVCDGKPAADDLFRFLESNPEMQFAYIYPAESIDDIVFNIGQGKRDTYNDLVCVELGSIRERALLKFRARTTFVDCRML